MGIWITFFPSGIEGKIPISHHIDNLSVFTYCIATLGSMAVEYVFEEKNKEPEPADDIEKVLSLHIVFFLWAISALLAFYALKSDDGIFLGLGSTLILWLVVNIHRPKFQAINLEATKNLDLDYKDENTQKTEMGGKGL